MLFVVVVVTLVCCASSRRSDASFCCAPCRIVTLVVVVVVLLVFVSIIMLAITATCAIERQRGGCVSSQATREQLNDLFSKKPKEKATATNDQ